MTMKKALICLSIVAILTLCVPNVAAASTSKYSADVHNGRVTDVRGQLKTDLYVALSDPDSGTAVDASNCRVAAGKTAFLDGRPIGGIGGVTGGMIHPDHTTDAVVNIQSSHDGKTWATILTTTTSGKGDKNPWFSMVFILQKSVGVGHYRGYHDTLDMGK